MWPFNVQQSIKSSHWITSCKVFYRLKKRYWEDKQGGKYIPQLISTDTRLQGVYGYAVETAAIHDPGMLLVSYTWEDDANKLLADGDDTTLAEALARRDRRILMGCTNVARPISAYVHRLAPEGHPVGEEAVVSRLRQALP